VIVKMIIFFRSMAGQQQEYSRRFGVGISQYITPRGKTYISASQLQAAWP